MNIAISSIGTATAVGLLKCIRNIDKDIKIIGLDINELGYTAGSLLVDNFYKVPLYNDKLYCEKLLSIFVKEKIDMFIPIHDFEVKKVAEFIELFKGYKIIIPNIDMINLFSDKYKANIEMQKTGISIPKIVDTNYSYKKILREKVSVGSKGVKVIHGNFDIKLNEDEFLQEYIEGEEYTVDILADLNGQAIIIIPRKRLEVKAGVATKTKLVYESRLINMCKIILSRYKIPGLSNVQFIEGKDGNFYFIELNTRFGGMSISSVLGSFNYIGDFIQLAFHKEISHKNFEENMQKVKWNSIITRYYEEKIYYEE